MSERFWENNVNGVFVLMSTPSRDTYIREQLAFYGAVVEFIRDFGAVI